MMWWRLLSMCRIWLVLFAILLAGPGAPAQRRGGGRGLAPASEQFPPIARSDSEKNILAAIDAATKAGELYANVPATDGRLLRLLTEAVNARQVVEIGTSTGLSGLWFGMALEKTDGKLTTFEFD